MTGFFGLDGRSGRDGMAAAAAIAAGRCRPEDLIAWLEDAHAALNPRLGLTTVFDPATARAVLRRGGVPGGSPLAGLPWLLKDMTLFCAPWPTSNGLAALASLPVPGDSLIVSRGRAAGLLPCGKTAVPEFGFSISSVSPVHGVTRNPWDPARAAGGSSGGAAAAVAARLVPFAHASDGAGSIRVPAAFCGVFGFKPSRGRTSYAPYLGDVWQGLASEGVISLSVRDAAAYLDIICGPAPGDPYALPDRADLLAAAGAAELGRPRIGLITDEGPLATDPALAAAVTELARELEAAGARIAEVSFTHDFAAISDAFLTLAAAIAAVEEATGTPFDLATLSPVVAGLIEAGRRMPAPALARAEESLRIAARAIAGSCAECDLLLLPAVPRAAPAADAFPFSNPDWRAHAEAVLAWLFFTLPFNVSGQPAASLPGVFDAAGMPLGIQLVARRGEDARLMAAAAWIERKRDWGSPRPPLSAA